MNKLQNQISPYLLQHKNNPVNWQPWTEEALQEASQNDQPIILSIGYAACHWCHVMEHESFEDLEVAQLMNEHFVCIKVDREERPDIDQIYMEAIHQMGLSGGWPLNVFLMPDQKPFYGGTYFPKNKWIQVLKSIQEAYQNHKNELQKSADGFQKSISENIIQASTVFDYTSKEFQFYLLNKINSSIDPYFGGINKAPKFPMPSLWNLLNETSFLSINTSKSTELLDLTLTKMAQGGIFDHVEGGFSRYSVDSEWFCPHFEKMLYDNGQLLSVYAKAFKRTQSDFFQEVIHKTIQFHLKQMKAKNGLYFSSIDADSEGVEGKYYVYTFDELNQLVPFSTNQDFYHDFSISKNGNWEHGNNILFKKNAFLTSKYQNQFNILYQHKTTRIAPNIDTKQILSWNAIYLIGLIDVFEATQDAEIKIEIENLFYSIEKEFKNNSNWLHQSEYVEKPILAFLDDVGFLSLAYIKWYLITNKFQCVTKSEEIISFTVSNFFDIQSNYFTYSSLVNNKLIANLPELIDSVIPSSNSVVVECLLYLGQLLDKPSYTIMANKIIDQVVSNAENNPSYFSNWWRIISAFKWKPKIFIKSVNAGNELNELKALYPNDSSRIILLNKNDYDSSESYVVCQGDHCFAPVFSIAELNHLLHEII